MSNLMFVSFYATKCTHIRSDDISTGIARGVAISAKARLMILFHLLGSAIPLLW